MQTEYERGGAQKDEYGQDEVISVRCPFCGSAAGQTLCVEHGAIGIKKCAGCSLIYNSPRARDPETVYWGDRDRYLTEAKLIFSGRAPHHRDPNYLEELELIETHRPGKRRFLDVGCSMGMLLRIARSRGWEVVGVEPSPALSRIASEELGLTVHNCFLDSVPATEEASFDVVALSDVFEHVTEPRILLRTAARFLKPGGLLYVKVPNARWSILKQRATELLGHRPENAWDSYEHVVHYTDRTLQAILQAEGFEPLLVTVARPIQVPVWHRCVGQYYQYPSPWMPDRKRYLGRSIFYALSRLERMLRNGAIGYCAPNLVVVAERA